MTKNQSNYLGDYEVTIRGEKRSALGVGHTRREACINALDCAAITWPHNSHIYQLLKQRGSHAMEAV